MEAIRNLSRLWGPLTCSRSILSPTISTHQINFWMRAHPGGGGFCLAIRQKVNDFVALHVDQNTAEFPATPEGEVIYSKLYHLLDWLCRQRHHAAENGHPTGLYPQSICHACSKHSTSSKPNGLNTLILPPRHTCPGFNKRSQALCEDFA